MGLTHGNVIFYIIEPPAFQKYSICWVFQAFFCSTFLHLFCNSTKTITNSSEWPSFHHTNIAVAIMPTIRHHAIPYTTMFGMVVFQSKVPLILVLLNKDSSATANTIGIEAKCEVRQKYFPDISPQKR